MWRTPEWLFQETRKDRYDNLDNWLYSHGGPAVETIAKGILSLILLAGLILLIVWAVSVYQLTT